MSRGLLLGSLIVVAAAGAGYWMFANPAKPHENPNIVPILAATVVVPIDDDSPQCYRAGNSAEVIDLSHVFEPTGQELDVQNLLDATEGPESLPLPRVAAGVGNLFSRQAAFVVSRAFAEVLCGSMPLAGSTMRGDD